MLTIKNINQYYGGSHILRDVSLQAELGKVTVILGRNGVGKTTLLKSMMGLIPIKTGSIELDGKAIQKATPYERARAGMGFVPQGREIFGRLTVEENLRMGLASRSATSAAQRWMVNPSRLGPVLIGGVRASEIASPASAPRPSMARLTACHAWLVCRPCMNCAPCMTRTAASSQACASGIRPWASRSKPRFTLATDE